MSESGRLIARGREADLIEHGDGRVLRRYRVPADAEREARTMEHARVHGFPVPAVHEVLGPRELVIERVDGPTMLTDMARRPWALRRHARLLAELHRRLHAVPVPDSLRAPFGAGDALLHLDLHPENVILSPRGPVVIDWSSAARGDPALDVAMTWLLVGTSELPGNAYRRLLGAAGRNLFLATFLDALDRSTARGALPAAAIWRLQHATLTCGERAAIARVAGL